MQLRLEPVQPYTLFPPMTTTTTTNNTNTTNSNSTSSYYYQQQQHSQQVFPPLPNPYRDALLPPLITTTTNNTTTKRLSAFEPVIASNHNSSNNTSPVTPSPPPIVDDIPRLADFASSIIYLMWHARKKMSLKSVNQAYLIDATKPSPAFKKFCLQVCNLYKLKMRGKKFFGGGLVCGITMTMVTMANYNKIYNKNQKNVEILIINFISIYND